MVHVFNSKNPVELVISAPIISLPAPLANIFVSRAVNLQSPVMYNPRTAPVVLDVVLIVHERIAFELIYVVGFIVVPSARTPYTVFELVPVEVTFTTAVLNFEFILVVVGKYNPVKL